MKWAALVAASAVASGAFVGCSCGNAVDNSMDNMNQIEMQSDVTLSSAETTVTTTTAGRTSAATNVTTTTCDTTSTTKKSETGTTISRAIQFVGQSQARNTTAKPTVVTKVVIVTVTRAPEATAATAATTVTTTETTAETTTVTTAATTFMTTLMPEGLFHADVDMSFIFETWQMNLGGEMPELDAEDVQKTETAAADGGITAYVYSGEGFTVTSEVYANPDGSTQERIREIVMTGEKVCTVKGIKAGSSTDDIIAAYGTEGLEITETFIYRYKTEDGRVLDICTDGSSVKEIKYYTDVQ